MVTVCVTCVIKHTLFISSTGASIPPRTTTSAPSLPFPSPSSPSVLSPSSVPLLSFFSFPLLSLRFSVPVLLHSLPRSGPQIQLGVWRSAVSSPSGFRANPHPFLFSSLPPISPRSPLPSVPLLSFYSLPSSLSLRFSSVPVLIPSLPRSSPQIQLGSLRERCELPQWVTGQIPLPFLSPSSPSILSPFLCPSTFLLLPPPLSPYASPFPFSSLPCREAAPKSS